MELKTLIAECTAYDFKVMLEEKKPKSWLKSVSAFANGLGGLFFGIDNEGIIFASTDTPNVGDHDGDMSETKLIERQQKILNLIKESPTITGRQMSDTLSVSQHTIERDLSTMQKKGVLKHEGKDNDGAWMMYAASKKHVNIKAVSFVTENRLKSLDRQQELGGWADS
jgi:predicted HTH transcriptional regulator